MPLVLTAFTATIKTDTIGEFQTLNMGAGVDGFIGLSLASNKKGVPSISPQVIIGDSPIASGLGAGVATKLYPPTLGVAGPISLPSTSTRPVNITFY